jgi:hypothetical protein
MFEELLELCNTRSAELEREQKKVQEMTDLLVGMNKLSGYINSNKNDVVLLGRLIDQVDRFSKELADLKSQMTVKRSCSVQPAQGRMARKGRSLDNRAKALIEILIDRPGDYSTRDLVDMLGINRVLVWQVMKRAQDMDPKHIRLTKGKRRALYISYAQDEPAQVTVDDPTRLELMSMTGGMAKNMDGPTVV